MTPAPETLTVTSEKLACDGGNDVSGHPRVYLTMKKDGAGAGSVDCPYCGRHYVLDRHAVQHDAH